MGVPWDVADDCWVFLMTITMFAPVVLYNVMLQLHSSTAALLR